MTEVKYDRENFCMSIAGHAGSAPKGSDMVCAAASMLAMTLQSRLSESEEMTSSVLTKPGSVTIRAVPSRGWERRCRESFDTIFSGFALLAENCPENVSVREL